MPFFQKSIRCGCYIKFSYSKCLYQELWLFASLCGESHTAGNGQLADEISKKNAIKENHR